MALNAAWPMSFSCSSPVVDAIVGRFPISPGPVQYNPGFGGLVSTPNLYGRNHSVIGVILEKTGCHSESEWREWIKPYTEE